MKLPKLRKKEAFYNTEEEILSDAHHSAHLTCIIQELELDVYEPCKGLSKLHKHDTTIDTLVNDILTCEELALKEIKGGKLKC